MRTDLIFSQEKQSEVTTILKINEIPMLYLIRTPGSNMAFMKFHTQVNMEFKEYSYWLEEYFIKTGLSLLIAKDGWSMFKETPTMVRKGIRLIMFNTDVCDRCTPTEQIDNLIQDFLRT